MRRIKNIQYIQDIFLFLSKFLIPYLTPRRPRSPLGLQEQVWVSCALFAQTISVLTLGIAYTSTIISHNFVGYNSRPRQHIRTKPRRQLIDQFCTATQKYYPFFTTDHKDAVFAGDTTVDVIDDTEEKKSEA